MIGRRLERDRPVPRLESPRLAAFAEGGCHGPEQGCCWTDGELDLPAEIFRHLWGAFTLIVHTQRQTTRAGPAAIRLGSHTRRALGF